MRRPTSSVLLAAALVTGCAVGDAGDTFIGCRGDSDCGDEEVCFPDGCGDPGKNIVVEVVANPKGGLHAQDFRVDDLRSQQNIELYDSATLQGQVRVQGTSSSGAYSAPITLRMTGESLLIPGVARHHESTLVPENGGYSLPVATGRYTVTLLATGSELPPVSSTREVQPGRSVMLDFTLPVSSELVRLSGKVVRQDGTPVDVDLEMQALDDELRPLSQRVTVRRDTGEFTLALPPSAAQRNTVVLQVVPTSATALVPLKQFTVSPRQGLQQPLSMGDYGEPVRFKSRVLGRDGQPVAQATVSLLGKVGGGGLFRSQKVLTDANGFFELPTLANEAGNVMILSVVPPSSSNSGLTQKFVHVPRASIVLSPDVTCGGRMRVHGTLQKPSDSQPAAGVRVLAEPIDELAGWPRPSFGFEASRTTDDQGHFEIALDPGRYRFDFIPAEDLPRVSRIVTVRPMDGTPDDAVLELSPFTLSKGRRVTGQVSFNGSNPAQPTAPYASIRFFRVVDVEGKRSALLLSQTLTDQNGGYSTTVPTR
ncbi:carboxypeptidase regulatory-like domain-containing protein [Archangium sp.]|uniref:carboxypeptidase regulatory-like domain-containing protein n=1 Tax=Archangium sp. TaxID=1872627 RepID=UPI002D4B85D5|nr:carboxypeptidase regulatory-like domain-containing protein [Archangium sp.]HYO54540.1 carboxypeptidase regulatory-like domain-containing protein [Archangium sp.]